jgi:hypothetical protein
MARKKRQRMGGNKKKKFTEGWVEFLDKGNAKVVAKTLNNQPVGVCDSHSLLAGRAPRLALLHGHEHGPGIDCMAGGGGLDSW